MSNAIFAVFRPPSHFLYFSFSFQFTGEWWFDAIFPFVKAIFVCWFLFNSVRLTFFLGYQHHQPHTVTTHFQFENWIYWMSNGRCLPIVIKRLPSTTATGFLFPNSNSISFQWEICRQKKKRVDSYLVPMFSSTTQDYHLFLTMMITLQLHIHERHWAIRSMDHA